MSSAKKPWRNCKIFFPVFGEKSPILVVKRRGLAVVLAGAFQWAAGLRPRQPKQLALPEAVASLIGHVFIDLWYSPSRCV